MVTLCVVTQWWRVLGGARAVITGVSEDVVPVDEGMVREWAEGTLQEWLTGYTHDLDHPQYKITYLDDGVYEVAGVFPSSGHLRPKRFRIQVSVTDLFQAQVSVTQL